MLSFCKTVSAVVLAGSFALAGCASETTDDGPMSWETFRAGAQYDGERGIYIINGDETARDEQELADLYRRYVAQFDDGIGESRDPLIVNIVGGERDVWAPGTTLTYCIGNGFTAARKTALVNALNTAGGAWSSAGNINFQYVPGQDGKNCNDRNNNVTFNVRYVCPRRQQYIASAFFPSYGRRDRELSVDCSAFDAAYLDPWTIAGVMRHELGHTIGFRHEHVEAPGNPCAEGGSWEQLTAYDSESVMHYPQCNGTQDGDLVLTADDHAGAAIAYP
jgi:hypothetical protein